MKLHLWRRRPSRQSTLPRCVCGELLSKPHSHDTYGIPEPLDHQPIRVRRLEVDSLSPMQRGGR